MFDWNNTLTKRNKYPLRTQVFLNQFGWNGKYFIFAGVPINLANLSYEAKIKLYYLASLCFAFRVQADKVEYFTDPSGNTTYKYVIYTDELSQKPYVIDNLENVPQECGALMVDGSIEEALEAEAVDGAPKIWGNLILNAAQELFALIYTSTTEVTVGHAPGESTKTIDSASLYRAVNETVQNSFENCMENGMDDADKLHVSLANQFIAAGVVIGSILCCACIGVLIYKFCCDGKSSEKQPLLPSKNQPQSEVNTLELSPKK